MNNFNFDKKIKIKKKKKKKKKKHRLNKINKYYLSNKNVIIFKIVTWNKKVIFKNKVYK